MKIKILSFLLIFSGVLSVMGQEESRVYFTITFADKKPVAYRPVQVMSQALEPLYSGSTDENGKIAFNLKTDADYVITFTQNGKMWKMNLAIPYDPRKISYLANCVIDTENGVSYASLLPWDISGDKSAVTITLIDRNNKNIANSPFLLTGENGAFSKECITDATGAFETELRRNNAYEISMMMYGLQYTGGFAVPDVDRYLFNFKMDLSIDTVYEYESGINSGRTKLILKVTDENGVPEQEAVIRLLREGTILKECTTGIDGDCISWVNQDSIYLAEVSKMGKIFPVTIEMPRDVILSEYEFTIIIKVVEEYRRSWVLDNVYFDTDKYDLRSDAHPALNSLYQTLSHNPGMVVEIAGHTDSDGDDNHNMHLSQHRANAVRNYLVQKGIASHRIFAKGYGETSPVATNDTPEGRQKNRRTEVRVISE